MGKTYEYKFPADQLDFPVKPASDWVILERIPIVDNPTKKMSKSNLIMSGGVAPKNIMDIEAQKTKAAMTYEDAESEFLKMWDEHPFQGIVRAVGDGRWLNETQKIPIGLIPGDHVFYRGKTGEPIVIEKKMYWMIKEFDIFGIYLSKTEK